MYSRYWRNLLLTFVVGILLDYALALTISFYFNDEKEFLYALAIMAWVWGLQLAVWLKGQVVSTAFYYMMGKKMWVAEVETALRVNEFPIYDTHRPDALDYLAMVAKDDRSNIDQVMYAAASIGQVEMLKVQKPTTALKAMAVFEKALDNYIRNPYPITSRRKG